MAMLARLLLEEPPPLRTLRAEVPGALERLVARMLAERRGDRPADGAAVAAELTAIAGDMECELACGRPSPESQKRLDLRFQLRLG